jgi:hypothetical protein
MNEVASWSDSFIFYLVVPGIGIKEIEQFAPGGRINDLIDTR